MLQVWLGHTQALKACEGGLLLNVNPTASAFIQAAPVEKFIEDALRVGNVAHMPDHLKRKAGKAIMGLKVCHCCWSACVLAQSIPASGCWGKTRWRQAGRLQGLWTTV